MGTLIAKAYPTKLFANAADHTYVQCSGGRKAWSCWGGKTGGKQIGQGAGSTTRADKIAQPDEKAGIKCYLVNGVCHQAANRILMAAGITVRNARGYGISHALFGTYGRVGSWPCHSPFKRFNNVTGDLPACTSPPRAASRALKFSLSDSDKLDWQYTRSVQKMYMEAGAVVKKQTMSLRDAESFHARLFKHMVEFELGSMLDKGLARNLGKIHRETEKTILKAQSNFALEEMKPIEYISEINKQTINFQKKMANVMKAEQYKSLFGLAPGENIVLADPKIVKKVYRVDI